MMIKFKVILKKHTELIELILHKKNVCFAINAECINIALNDKEYFNILNNENSIVYLDGMGAVYAARLKGIKVPERIATTDLIIKLLEKNETLKKHPRIFFLGSKQKVARSAQEMRLKTKQTPSQMHMSTTLCKAKQARQHRPVSSYQHS